MSRKVRRAGRRPARRLATSALIALAGALLTGAVTTPAHAAGESVNIWLTTTDDSGGRHVTRGLQQQTPITFGTGGSGAQNITVNENTRYQQFTGAGASFTDTAAWLMNSSGALSSTTRTQVMQKLFDPGSGIGLDFLRNPMGASDLARYSYSYDDLPAGQTDAAMSHFSISHDLADILPLTKQARQLNPALKVMGTPWSAPAWMKDNGQLQPAGLAPVPVLRGVRPVLRQVRPGVPGAGRADRLRLRAERADLLRRVPVDELERLWPGLLHQDEPAAGVPRRRPVDQGPRARLELGHLRQLRRPAGGRRGDTERLAVRRASPGTATAAT